MKKLMVCALLVVIISIFSPITVSAQVTQDHIYKVDCIMYDVHSSLYVLNIIDENGEVWIIELFQSKFDRKLFNRINYVFKNEWIVASVEDYNNNDLYDDEILEWEILE
jgi:hypothetical protein